MPLLEKYSLEEIGAMEVADLADYLKEKGRNRFPDPEKVAKCIPKGCTVLLSFIEVRRRHYRHFIGYFH